ncbi:hypothetical protein Golax_014751, partial [Gossypium laxum]|nr:hypothetical protein [Gossypium laxum]
MIPKGLCDEIKLMDRRFIWGSQNGDKKMALVSWDSICQPRSHRGLGLRHLRDHNTSFMMKLGFNIVTNSIALKFRVLRLKYGVQSGLLDDMVTSDGSWNLDLFFIWVTKDFIAKIVGIPSTRLTVCPDKIIWLATSTGFFSLKSAYSKIREGVWNSKEYLGSCTVLEAELWGILDGLNLSLDWGFENNLIQTDNLESIHAIQKDTLGERKSTLIRR